MLSTLPCRLKLILPKSFGVSLGFSIILLALGACQKNEGFDVIRATAEPASLVLTSESPSADITLFASTLTQPEHLPWRVTSLSNWLTVVPMQGDLTVNNQATVIANSQSLFTGMHNGEVVISVSGKTVVIPVTFEVTESEIINMTPDSILLNYNENSKSAVLMNNSNQTLAWQITPSSAFLSVSPSTGSLAANQSATITVNVNRNGLDNLTYTEHLNLLVNGSPSADFKVIVLNETKILLDGLVIDAEYDRVHDRLVVVNNYSRLLKIDPISKVIVSVDLSLPPTCVSIGMNGQYAAVGHDGWVSVVNLTSMQVESTYAVSTNALDIVLAPNFWAYVFPKTDQWEHIRCINLQNGSETLHTGFFIYAGTKAKLHPSGEHIYGANNGLSPSDVEKYSISSGTATYLYDSPYHGDYPMSGDLWISDDGNRMYTRGRTVLNLSANQSGDLIYGGTLPGDAMGIKTLDQTSATNRVCAVMLSFMTYLPDSNVKVYSYPFLNPIGTLPLPKFLGPNLTLISSEGHFGFFHSDGKKFFVVVKSSAPLNTPSPWAVATLTVD